MRLVSCSLDLSNSTRAIDLLNPFIQRRGPRLRSHKTGIHSSPNKFAQLGRRLPGNRRSFPADYVAWQLLLFPHMTTGTAIIQAVPAKMRYSSILRCVGQSLEGMELKSVDIKSHGDDFIVQGWNRGPSMSMDVEKHYTPEDLCKLDAEGRQKRKPFVEPPDLLSLSQILRLAGNYVDRMRGRLLRVSWQDQSDKIQSITVQWQAPSPAEAAAETLAVVEELCMHIYKQRKKMPLVTERQAQIGRAHV